MVSRALLTFALVLVRLESEGKNVGLVLFRGTCTFFPVRRQKFKSPIKCLSNYVDKHIKIGFAQIYQKKRPPRQLRACTSITDFRQKAIDQTDVTGAPDGPKVKTYD